jgi:transposase
MTSHQQRRGKYPDELRERAVRMVLDHGHEYGSQWEAICSVADKLGPKAETVRLWVRTAEVDQGRRLGPTSEELAELKRLRQENALRTRYGGTGVSRRKRISTIASSSPRPGHHAPVAGASASANNPFPRKGFW